MTRPRLVPAVPALVAVATALAMGACSQGGDGTASPAHAPAPHVSTPAATVSPRVPRLRVRPAGFRLPAAVGREAVIGAGCSALVAGGLASGDTTLATTYRIDLRHGRVRAMPHLQVPVHDTAGGLALDPLVIGGGNTAEQDVVEGWHHHTWRVVGHLPQARSDLVAATVGGLIVVAGGYDGTRPAEPDILGSTDGSTWQVIGTLPTPVRYPASTVARGAVWLFGGEAGGAMQTAIQRIDPATGRAVVVGRLPHPLGHGVAVPLGRRILVVGGRTAGDAPTARMSWFDPATGTVTSAGRLPHPLSDSAVAHCGDTTYLLGGETPVVTDQVLAVTYR